LTGAKILISGSVLRVDKNKRVLVAKIVGTETTRILGDSVDGPATDELGPLVEKLADKIADLIAEKGAELVAPPVIEKDRFKALNAQLKTAKRPTLSLSISERHAGQASADPAAQTEIELFCQNTGFPVIDAARAPAGKADVIVTGEGVSEFASRHGNLVSVKARLEVKAVDRVTGQVVAAERQTSVVVDLTEQIAAKTAMQQAAAAIAERLLPKLASRQ
jgi:hypothetical protein